MRNLLLLLWSCTLVSLPSSLRAECPITATGVCTPGVEETIVITETESIEYDKIEVVGQYKHVQVRKATVIKKDGTELTRSFERYVLDPGTLDSSDNLVDNPLSKEPDGTTNIADEVKAICNAVWTSSVKNAWKAKLIADKPA